MKVASIHDYSGPTAVRIDEVEVLQPCPGEVRIRVGAAGINNSDLQTTYRTGSPSIMGKNVQGCYKISNGGLRRGIGNLG